MTHIFDFWLQIYDSLCCSESNLDQIIHIFKLEAGIHVHSVQKACTQYCPCCPQNLDFKNLVSRHVTRLKTSFLLTYLTEGGVMTKIHSPAGLFFLSLVKIRACQAKKCLGVSGNSNIQRSMLSHSEGQGILILTKDTFWPYDVCEGNR